MVLWYMPRYSRTEKIAARALIANRMLTALVLLAILTALMIAGVAFSQDHDFFNGAWTFLTAGALYFGIAAFDGWRVRGRRFAERPAVLFRYDMIHIEYLEPV